MSNLRARLMCWLFGHKWEPEYVRSPDLDDGLWYCTRCWRLLPNPDRAAKRSK